MGSDGDLGVSDQSEKMTQEKNAKDDARDA
jgi:hypothetical protein